MSETSETCTLHRKDPARNLADQRIVSVRVLVRVVVRVLVRVLVGVLDRVLVRVLVRVFSPLSDRVRVSSSFFRGRRQWPHASQSADPGAACGAHSEFVLGMGMV